MDSWAEWVRRPEYAYLMSALQDLHDEAAAALIGANANDPAQIGMIQASIRLYRALIDGEVKEMITEEIKTRELNG